MHKTTKEAVSLYLKGQMVLSQMSAAGIRVDRDYLERAIGKTQRHIGKMEEKLRDGKVARLWKREYGEKMNFGSRSQLARILFDKMGIRAEGKTRGGDRDSTSKGVLERIDHPFVRAYLQIEPAKKSLSTNLLGLKREMVERDGLWFVHPNFRLNKVVTYRSASDSPNWQNLPKRDPIIGSMVRRCFVPMPGWHFVDSDFSTIEVRVAAAITSDRELNRYVRDESSDMHRDQACEFFLLKKDQVTKQVRQTTKTNAVFAGFYGSPAYNCAKKLWEDIDRFRLETADGVPMKEHLGKKGITNLGIAAPDADNGRDTFVGVCEAAQRKMWERFVGYRDWRRQITDKYHREGSLQTVTGFVVRGPHSRTEIPNYPIQCAAFHCELWSIIEIARQLRKYQMETRLLGEIHDSHQADVPPGELQDYLDICHEVMTVKLPKAWDWIAVPLEIEQDVSPVNGSWHDCNLWTNQGGTWALKS